MGLKYEGEFKDLGDLKYLFFEKFGGVTNSAPLTAQFLARTGTLGLLKPSFDSLTTNCDEPGLVAG